MRRFSVTEAGFSGYRLLVSRPGVTIWWLAFWLLASVTSVAALVWLAGPQITAMREIQEAGPGAADPATIMELNRQMMGYHVFGSIFPWVIWVVATGAVVRAMLRRGGGALGHLAFGADECRLLVTTLVTGLLTGVVCLVAAIAVVIILVGSSGPGIFRDGLGHAPPSALAPAAIIALLGVTAAVFLIVKLSLASAQTVTDRAIRIFSSWGITKGNFWVILGAYLLALLPVLAGWIIGVVLLIALNPGSHGASSPMQLLDSLQPDVSSMSAAFSPTYWPMYAIQAVMQTLSMAGLIAPGVMILQALRADTETEVEDDDDDDDDD